MSFNPADESKVLAALNSHGVFLKKAIVEIVSKNNGLTIVAEEHGESFGETRVLDLLIQDNRVNPRVFYAIECKRAWRKRKRWLFFRDINQDFRVARCIAGVLGPHSVFSDARTALSEVCSEGYEIDYEKTSTSLTADQDPVFKAASQLAAAYLGFVARRCRDLMRAGTSLLTAHSERIIPVLVTNAEIAIVEGDWMQVDLRNGVLSKLPSFSERSEIVLKHPFPTPIGLNADFRESPSCDPDMLPRFWNQQFKESVHIVQANSLERFFATDNRDKLRSLESIT